MSRKITVYTTGSGVGKVIETSSVNWGQLKAELGKEGVGTSSMKAVIGKTKTNLEHSEAIIPDEDFTLFLFPEKTRSGAPVYTDAQIKAMSFSEIRAALKVISGESEATFKAHFNVGKNYTTKTTDEIKALLISYQAKNAPKGKAKTATESLPKAAPKAEAVKAPIKSDKPARIKREVVQEGAATEVPTPTFKNDDEKINFIIDLISGMTSPISDQKDRAISAIASLKAGSEVKGVKSTSFTIIDNASLGREAEQIARGLSGIK